MVGLKESILRATCAALITLSLLSGCCSTRQCPGLQDPAVSGQEGKLRDLSRVAMQGDRAALVDQKGETLEGAFVRAIREKRTLERKALSEPVSVRVLSLSGGGPKGAYGAGFLNGLASNVSTRESLEYDIVTGISTGAIQATFVFLGPEYYDELRDIYYEEHWETYVPEKSKLSLLFCGNSLRKFDAFRSRLEERYVTNQVIRRVAEVAEKTDRQLIIGTVNLDTGLFQTWDLVDLARRGKYTLYRDVILASSAIPVVFPPVELERQEGRALHVDGGTRHIAFVPLLVQSLAKATAAEGGESSPSVDVLINNSFYSFPECVQNRVLDIASRSVTTLLKQSIENDIARAYVTACANLVPFRMTSFGAGFLELEGDFYPGMRKDMRRLYDFGFEKAKSTGWGTLPEEIEGSEDLETLCRGRTGP